MIEVYWLEQTGADLPPKNDWLSANEMVRLNTMRVPKRHADWRLGRWTAKRALAACLNLPDDPQTLARIEIRPAASGAPEVFMANQPAPVALSISHRAGRAISAVTRSGASLGCDLELIEPRTEAFISDYFAVEEQALIMTVPPADRARIAILLWSAKESALKALQVGLQLDTRRVIVGPGDLQRRSPDEETPDFTVLPPQEPGGWRPLKVRCEDQAFQGWWQQRGNLVMTVVTSPPSAPPRFLNIPDGQRLT